MSQKKDATRSKPSKRKAAKKRKRAAVASETPTNFRRLHPAIERFTR